MPLPRSLAHLKREITEKKWTEARQRGCGKFQEACLKVLPTEYGALCHRAVPSVDKEPPHHPVQVVPVSNSNVGAPLQVCPEWKVQRKVPWAEVLKVTGRWRSGWNVRDLLADGRCSQAVLDFLSTMDLGRLAPTEGDGAARCPNGDFESVVSR